MSDVAIIGGGLSGLAAARTLRNAGIASTLFEASGRLGGQVRSEHIDGITVDHGFQLLNSWYPSLKELLSSGEYAALDLRSFDAGIQTFTSAGSSFIGDPVRSPRVIKGLLSRRMRSILSVRELMGLRAWLGTELSHRSSVELRRISERRRAKDCSIKESLDRSGITRQMRVAAADPLVRAFLLDTDGETSALFAKWVFGTLLRGAPTIPAQGMGDVASLLGRNNGVNLQLNATVTQLHLRESHSRSSDGSVLSPGGVDVVLGEHGRSEFFPYVILAVPQKEEARLLNKQVQPTRGQQTSWFLAPEPVTPRPVIVVDGTGKTPVASVAELTAAAASYAPGRHLVQATVAFGGSSRALQPSDIPDEAELLAQVGMLVGADTSTWELVTRQHIPDIFPVFTARQAQHNAHEKLLVGGHVMLAGVQHATPSLDGALRSGQRAAQRIIAELKK